MYVSCFSSAFDSVCIQVAIWWVQRGGRSPQIWPEPPTGDGSLLFDMSHWLAAQGVCHPVCAADWTCFANRAKKYVDCTYCQSGLHKCVKTNNGKSVCPRCWHLYLLEEKCVPCLCSGFHEALRQARESEAQMAAARAAVMAEPPGLPPTPTGWAATAQSSATPLQQPAYAYPTQVRYFALRRPPPPR